MVDSLPDPTNNSNSLLPSVSVPLVFSVKGSLVGAKPASRFCSTSNVCRRIAG
jgi:hypothetical protein